jgi:hypothetical protein
MNLGKKSSLITAYSALATVALGLIHFDFSKGEKRAKVSTEGKKAKPMIIADRGNAKSYSRPRLSERVDAPRRALFE